MKSTFRSLPKRDGTLIQVPSMPWSSASTPPEIFSAPCGGQDITSQRVLVIQGALLVWQWQYCACMREALALAEEGRQQVERRPHSRNAGKGSSKYSMRCFPSGVNQRRPRVRPYVLANLS